MFHGVGRKLKSRLEVDADLDDCTKDILQELDANKEKATKRLFNDVCT